MKTNKVTADKNEKTKTDIDLMHALDVFEQAINAASDVLALPTTQATMYQIANECWLNEEQARAIALDAFTDVYYEDGQTGRETRIYPGIIFIASDNKAVFEALNDAKRNSTRNYRRPY